MPLALSEYTKGSSSINVRARSLRMVIDELEHRFPGIRYRICDEKSQVRPYVNIFVNSINIRGRLNTRLRANDVIHIIRSIAGG